MANAQTPPLSTTTPPPSTDAARGTDALSLDRLRGAVPIAEHAAQLAAQAQLEAIMRDLEVSNAKVRDLEAVASKTAVVEQAQRHEMALVDRKHVLTMEGQRQQWALDDARSERNRQLAEADRARNAVAEAQRVAEVRSQAEAIEREVANLQAACVTERARIRNNSIAAGGFVGFFGGYFVRKAQGTKGSRTFAGIAGATATVAPFLAPMLRAPLALTAPSTPSGWDAHLLAMTAERGRLYAELAALRATAFDPAIAGVGAFGAGALAYAITS